MKKVWIDAGHGGKDPGAVGNGLQEKDIALSIANDMKRKLESNYEDTQVMLSRSTDVYLSLTNRSSAANSAGADILVSIHCNSGGGAGGFESYRYTSAMAASVALQNIVHAETMSVLLPFGVIDRGKKVKNLHMVRESSMPAILTENLFIDVVSDAQKLKAPEVIKAIVDGHVSGIAKYLGLKKKEAPESARDIHVVSPWAAKAWEEAVANGYFDGTRPGAPITREEAAIVMSRLSKNLMKLIDERK